MKFKMGDIVKLNPNIQDSCDYTEEELLNNRYKIVDFRLSGVITCKNLKTGLVTSRYPEEILPANNFRLIRREYLCQNLKQVIT